MEASQGRKRKRRAISGEPISDGDEQQGGRHPQIRISVHQPEPSVRSIPAFNPRISPKESYESSLSRNPEVDFYQSLSRSVSPADGYIIPETVTYSLYITFEGQEVANAPKNILISPNNPSSYDDIAAVAEGCVEAQYGPTALAGRSVNFRQGDCTITCDKHEENDHDKPTQGLSNQADWKDICTVLTNLWTSSRHKNIHLDIHRDYFGLLTRRVSDESFANAKRGEIWTLMKSAFDGRKYIPRSDLLRVASMDMVRGIITDDPTVLPAQKERFIQDVYKKASILLTMCVLTQLRMECLKALLDKGKGDDTYPLEQKDCCHKKCGPNFDNLLQYQGGFHAAVFFRPGEHKKLYKGTVVPIHYYPKEFDATACSAESPVVPSEGEREFDDDDKDSEKYRAHCGSGVYSNVYRVRIDPAHHKLTKDKNAIFAVKEFKDRPLRTGTDFNKELKILDELRKYPHEHIVTHLATWTQDGRYYMLFSYAECNLRQYMKRNVFSEPTKRNILWLLAQFLGLSNALREIHNLSDSNNAPETTPNILAPTQKEVRKSGWHHDLKPENILYFILSESKHGSFQIADFGSGKVHTYRSGSVNTRSPNGTLTYEPPEAAKEGATSRPYDMWSMGCVFLELLIWATYGYQCVKSFRSNREERRFPDSHTDIVQDDAFWQIHNDGNIQRRKSVEECFEKLENDLQRPSMQPFRKVLGLVDRMLDKERQTRISALDLWDTLSRIFTQTKIDLEHIRSDSVVDQANRDSMLPLLPRLSTRAPDRRSPEHASPGAASRSEGYPPRSPNPLISGNFLTASPQATSSTLPGRRNSSLSNYTANSDTRMRERSVSNASSTHVQDGSSIHSHGGRTPDPTNA